MSEHITRGIVILKDSARAIFSKTYAPEYMLTSFDKDFPEDNWVLVSWLRKTLDDELKYLSTQIVFDPDLDGDVKYSIARIQKLREKLLEEK